MTTEMLFVRVQRRDRLAFLARQQLVENRAAVSVELFRQRAPVIARDARFRRRRAGRCVS
jgi:hypothetical protein